MQKEDQIIAMLEKVMGKLDEHSSILNEHSSILNEHSSILKEHSSILDEHSSILKEHSSLLKEHSSILDGHSSVLEDHSQMLRALQSGQEHLKAEFDGMRIATAKEFAELKEEQGNISTNFELLRDDTWANKVDIHRIKNTMGMK